MNDELTTPPTNDDPLTGLPPDTPPATADTPPPATNPSTPPTCDECDQAAEWRYVWNGSHLACHAHMQAAIDQAEALNFPIPSDVPERLTTH